MEFLQQDITRYASRHGITPRQVKTAAALLADAFHFDLIGFRFEAGAYVMELRPWGRRDTAA
jgi:hypothetical protein